MEVDDPVYTSIKRVGAWTIPSSSSESREVQRINFFFTLKKKITDRYQDLNSQYFLVREQRPQPIMNVVLVVNTPQGFDAKTTYTSIERKLIGWDLSNYWRKRVINAVLCSTQDMLKSVSPGENVFGVTVDVLIVQNRNFPLRDTTRDLMIQRSIEETGPSLVPATDSSIESLEKKELKDCDGIGTNCGSCRICLDEFPVNCQVVCMPCLHAFHGDCIEEWLRTSHYCPICRFEMPTS